MTTEVAIIGDGLMRSEIFKTAILKACGKGLAFRQMELPWPDEPMENGRASSALEGIKEFQGTAEQVVSHTGAAEVLVTQMAPLSASVFRELPGLRLVVVTRGGPVNADLAAAADCGIRVVNTPGRNASAVAEFTIGAILAQTRNITKGHDGFRRGEFRSDLYRQDLVGEELADMTVGVVGYGMIGRKVVDLLRAFECRIIVCDPYAELLPKDSASGVIRVEMAELLSRSDLVTLHSRAGPGTAGMIGETEFALMKPGAVFINTARGSLVDHDALFSALTEGGLGGAALDTFVIEPPPPDLPLRQLPNVTLTPHIAGASQRTIRIATRQAAEEIRRWMTGEPPLNPC